MKIIKELIVNKGKIIGGVMVIVGILMSIVGWLDLPRRRRKKVGPCITSIEFIRK